MMENTYWQQFMATGRVEDYLQFKAADTAAPGKQGTDGEESHAGFGECNRDSIDEYPRGRI
jgi:hypothetical protein